MNVDFEPVKIFGVYFTKCVILSSSSSSSSSSSYLLSVYFGIFYWTLVTQQWCNVYIMQLTTELHVSALPGHHQAYKIMELTKAHAVILPTGSRGLQFQCTLKYSM